MRAFFLLSVFSCIAAAQGSFTDTFPGTTLNTTNWVQINNSTGSVAVNNGLTIVGPGQNGIATTNPYDRASNNLTFSLSLTLNSLNTQSASCPQDLVIGFTTTQFLTGHNFDSANAIYDSSGTIFYNPYVPLTTPFGITLSQWEGLDKQSLIAAPSSSCKSGQSITIALNVNKLQGASISYNGTTSEIQWGAGNTLTAGYFFVETTGTTSYSISSAGVTVTPETGPAAPTGMVATGLNGAVLLQWTDNSCTPVDHYVQFKNSAGSAYAAFSHKPTIYPALTVYGLTNGTTYDFEVACQDSTGVGTLSAVVTASPSSSATPINFAGYYEHTITGQSNAVGQSTAISDTQPFSNVMLNSNITPTALIPLVENAFYQYAGIANGAAASTNFETMQNGFCDNLSNLNGSSYKCIAIVSAIGGTALLPDSGVATRNYDSPLADHQRFGSTNETFPAGPVYNTLLNYVQDAVNLGVAASSNVQIGSNAFFGDSSDDIQGTSVNDVAYQMNELANDIDATLRPITGQTTRIPTLFIQSTLAEKYPALSDVKIGTSSLGEFQAALNAGPDCDSLLYPVAPEYFGDIISDGQHTWNYFNQRLGEYLAMVHHQVVDLGQCWRPVLPLTSTITGSIVRVKFHVPTPPLVFDTTAVLAADDGFYGFEYADNVADLQTTTIVTSGGVTTINLSNTTVATNDLIQIGNYVNCNAAQFPLGTKVTSISGANHTVIGVSNAATVGGTISGTPCSFNTQQIVAMPTVDPVNTDTVNIQLSGVPSGVSPRLHYAYTVSNYPAGPTFFTGGHQLGSARGNLRDSNATTAYYCNYSTTAMVSGTTVTLAVPTKQPYSVGEIVNVSGMTQSALNGNQTITALGTGVNTIIYSIGTSGLTSDSGSVSIAPAYMGCTLRNWAFAFDVPIISLNPNVRGSF